MKIGHFFIALMTIFCCVISLDATEPYKNIEQNNKTLSSIQNGCQPNSGCFNAFADLIVWTAREAGADAWAEVIIVDGDIHSNDILGVDFGWDPGFRVGLGYRSKHDCWDTKFFYTWFHTKGTDDISSQMGAVHSTFLGNFYINNADGGGLSGPSYEKASIDWTIHFNIFDWQLSRNYRTCKALFLRPFIGIKGGWIDQSIHSKWENPDVFSNVFFSIGKECIENNFWGIGPAVGINTQWNLFCNELYLFYDFSGAVMWGHWSFNDIFQNDFPTQVVVDLQDINSGASMVRTFMGFGLDINFCKNQYRLSTKLGYEMQFWLDQLQFYSFTGGRLVNLLTLQGGTFELCLDF